MADSTKYIEVIISSLLRANTTVPVYTEDDPVTHEAKRIIVKNTGDSEADFIASANIACECYGTSTLDAKNLCEDVKALMRGFETDSRICRIRLNTSYKDNDTVKKEYRYRAVFNVISNT